MKYYRMNDYAIPSDWYYYIANKKLNIYYK